MGIEPRSYKKDIIKMSSSPSLSLCQLLNLFIIRAFMFQNKRLDAIINQEKIDVLYPKD